MSQSPGSIVSKKVIALVFTLMIIIGGPAQAGQWKLIETFSVDDDPKYPAEWSISEDLYAIDVTFKRRYKSDRCIGNYRVRFGFSRSFGDLVEDEPFRVEAVKIAGRTPCGHKWTHARVNGSKQWPKGHSRLPGDWETNDNIKITNIKGDWNNSGAIPLYDGAPAAMWVDVLPSQKKHTPYSVMSVRAGDNILYLLYKYVGGTKPSMPIQKSSFGNIDWQAGYYGNNTKTITVDERVPGSNGTSIVRGRWGRTNSSDSGYFEFRFSDSCTFSGEYWRGDGPRKKWDGWCG